MVRLLPFAASLGMFGPAWRFSPQRPPPGWGPRAMRLSRLDLRRTRAMRGATLRAAGEHARRARAHPVVSDARAARPSLYVYGRREAAALSPARARGAHRRRAQRE